MKTADYPTDTHQIVRPVQRKRDRSTLLPEERPAILPADGRGKEVESKTALPEPPPKAFEPYDENVKVRRKTGAKRELQNFFGVLTVSIMAIVAMSVETPKAQSSQTGIAPFGFTNNPSRTELPGHAQRASDLIGMNVKNYWDQSVGKVKDVTVDVPTGHIVQVILSTEGVPGLGNMLTAVPPGVLHRDLESKVIRLDADMNKLKAAPKFDMAQGEDSAQSSQVIQVYRYYGEEPDSTLTENTPVPMAGRVQQASHLIGKSVRNAKDEKVGKVEDLVMDLSTGRVDAMIVSTGGFIGISNELSAMPPAALRYNSETDTFQIDTTKEIVSNAPHFNSNKWPDFGQSDYANEITRAYGVEPSPTVERKVDSDNTARNTRDSEGRTLTPLNQGMSAADVDVTAKIRGDILAAKDMSVNARNVKIITKTRRVTLRGPVNTILEKILIGEIAGRVVRPENVDNQLEVRLAANTH